MTDNSPEASKDFLEGTEATQWFYGERGGGHILDHHLSAINVTFGREVPYRIRAAVDPLTGEPSVLMIEIQLPVDDEASWQRLVDLQERLIDDEPAMREIAQVDYPFNRIIVSLSGAPSHWADLIEEIEHFQ